MQTHLKKIFFLFLLPGLFLFLGLYFAREYELVRPGLFSLDPIWHSALFIGAALTGIAAPIFIRTLFAHRVKDATQVKEEAFMVFQKRLILVSGITPYFALIALACDLPQFYSGAIVLMALYALYYHFPSQKRIEFDQKIFRVKK